MADKLIMSGPERTMEKWVDQGDGSFSRATSLGSADRSALAPSGIRKTTMIGMRLHDKQSGITGIVDAEVVQADASVLVRIEDRWFIAADLVGAPD